ncbi:MAG: hypothetical protein HY816_22710 [Candidatus Wallbacteria bacterium]|nr:hypothetical protein [Candidatus Wallbacteria bacterium]
MIHQALAGALFHPRQQLRRSRQDQPLAAVLGAYLLAGFSWVLSDYLVHGQTRQPFSLFVDSCIYWMLLATAMGLAMIFANFFAELLGGRTDQNALFWGIAQSTAPLALLVPMTLMALPLGELAGVLYLPGKLAVFLWVFAAQVVAISEACALSVARATFVFFMGCGSAMLGYFLLSMLVPLAFIAKLQLLF